MVFLNNIYLALIKSSNIEKINYLNVIENFSI